MPDYINEPWTIPGLPPESLAALASMNLVDLGPGMPSQPAIAQRGRYGDSRLAHVTPDEEALLHALGGAGTINPLTGLPEFYPTDQAYTMADGGGAPPTDDMGPPIDEQGIAGLDPGSMSTLFGDDPDAGQDTAGPPGGGQVDQDKLQSVLSDPGLLAAVAQVLKTLGTGDDSDLVHVTEQEKQMLKEAGGSGTVNPTTGLLQYAGRSTNPVADWYGMTPSDRVARISTNYNTPGWGVKDWWSPDDTSQGGYTNNISAGNYASMNAAVHPSWGNALGFAGLVGSLGMGGPLGLALAMGKTALAGAISNKVLGKSEITDPFADPGAPLSQDAQTRVADAYKTGGLLGGSRQLDKERDAATVGAGGQVGGPGPGKSAGIGVDTGGHEYASNIGGAGVSHNLAAGAAAAGNIDRGSATIGGGRAGGGGAPGGDGGGDRGGGLGGGAGGRGGNRSD